MVRARLRLDARDLVVLAVDGRERVGWQAIEVTVPGFSVVTGWLRVDGRLVTAVAATGRPERRLRESPAS